MAICGCDFWSKRNEFASRHCNDDQVLQWRCSIPQIAIGCLRTPQRKRCATVVSFFIQERETHKKNKVVIVFGTSWLIAHTRATRWDWDEEDFCLTATKMWCRFAHKWQLIRLVCLLAPVHYTAFTGTEHRKRLSADLLLLASKNQDLNQVSTLKWHLQMYEQLHASRKPPIWLEENHQHNCHQWSTIAIVDQHHNDIVSLNVKAIYTLPDVRALMPNCPLIFAFLCKPDSLHFPLLFAVICRLCGIAPLIEHILRMDFHSALWLSLFVNADYAFMFLLTFIFIAALELTSIVNFEVDE